MIGIDQRKQLFRSIIIIVGSVFLLPILSRAAEGTRMIPASVWIDHEVYSKAGKAIGEIDDLVVNRSGKVKKITIDAGGFLGIGEKLVAVSPKELENLMVKESGRLILNTTEEQLEKRPEFDYYRRGLLPDYYYRPHDYNMYGYHAFPPPYPLYRPYGPGPLNRYPEPYPPEGLQAWAVSPSRFLATTVIGRRVVNESGRSLGKVADLLIDTGDAKIKKIVLAAGEIRGDDALVAIPYSPPEFTAFGIVCDISREEIRNLPLFAVGTH